MNRNKKVYSCIVCFHCLLIRRFIHICRTGVLHIQAMSLQNLSHRQRQTKGIILFFPLFINCSRISSSVSGIQHD